MNDIVICVNKKNKNFHISYVGMKQLNLNGEGADQFIGMPNVSVDERKLKVKGDTLTIHTKVINPKQHKTSVLYKTSDLGNTTINTTGQWKSASCPAGFE